MIIVLIVVCACTSRHGEWDIVLDKAWQLSDSLVSSESVIYHPGTKHYYISSSPEFAKTGRGYISKVSESGQMVRAHWVDGLNRPTGMAIDGDLLYVGDMDALIIIDTREGNVVNRIEAQSDDFPGINDVAINRQKEVYVTGSAVHSIFKLEDNKLKLWLQDSIALQWANGIVANNDHLVVAGQYLSRVDYGSKRIDKVIDSERVVDFDGLEPDGRGGYFVTSAGPGVKTLWQIKKDGGIRTLIRGENYHSDFDYIPEKEMIVAATGNHETKQYGIIAYKAKWKRFTKD